MLPALAATAICLAASARPYTGEPPALRAPRPPLPAVAPSAAAFVPPGWRLEHEASGNLDGDGHRDLAAIIRGTDPACLVRIDGRTEPMDTNPRLVIVAFGAPGGFRLRVANPRVVPRIDDPYMDDPLGPDGLSIRGDVLHLGLTSWRSMGGWSSFTSTLRFRWDGARMRLIGANRETVRRNSGETESLSVNYLTGRARVATGSIDDDGVGTVRWQRVRPDPAASLETIGDGLALAPLTGRAAR